MIKLTKLLLVLLFLLFTGCEDKPVTVIVDNSDYMKKMDPRLKAYPEAVEWYEDAEKYPEASANLGNFYNNKLKDYNEAIKWYKKAFNNGLTKVANNMGTAYEDLKNYDEAIKWYIKSDTIMSITNLGLLYKKKLKNYPSAIKYYKMAIERESIESTNSIATLYNELGDNIKASAYLLTLIKYSDYTKEEVLNYLRNDLKIDDETIKKGYELQLTMPGLPRRYTGGI